MNEPLLLSAVQAARLIGIGKSLFYSLHSSGQLGPMPIILSTKKLWRRTELEEWTRQGCPPRPVWLRREGGRT